MIKKSKGKIVGIVSDNPNAAKKRSLDKKRRLAEYCDFLKDDCDNDWDDILALLQYKLKRTRNVIERSTTTSDKKKLAAQIKRVETLLEKVYTHDYDKDINAEGHRYISMDDYGRRSQKMIETRMRSDLKKAFKIICDHCFDWWV